MYVLQEILQLLVDGKRGVSGPFWLDSIIGVPYTIPYKIIIVSNVLSRFVLREGGDPRVGLLSLS